MSNCADGSMIIDVTQCEVAGEAIGYSYWETVSSTNRPAGCYVEKDGGSWFNSDLTGSWTTNAKYSALCSAHAWTTTTTTTTTTYWQSPYFWMRCEGKQALTTESMTFEDYDSIFNKVESLYQTLPDTCNATYCPQADWAGCVLRMAGHDFMDYADGEGGSDACIDMDDIDNLGLAECLHEGEFGISMADAFVDFCTTISLADFVVVAAEAVMNISRQHVLNEDPSRAGVDFRSSFKYGRTTALSCSWAHGRLPNPEDSCSAVNTTFVQRMGLSWGQSAALMGVHTLGRAKPENSGYDGWWSDVENSRKFNNDYYVSVLLKGWGPEASIGGNPGKNQWKRIDRGVNETHLGKEMMLNTDMCFVYTMDNEGLVELDAATAVENNCSCTWYMAVKVSGNVSGVNFTENKAAELYNNNEFCGSTYIPGPDAFGLQRAICCGDEFLPSEDGKVSDEFTAADCGLIVDLKGPAVSQMTTFANDEDAWLSVFSTAWRIATTNGYESLKRL